MSQEVEDLLAREGMDDVDDLMRWARERAANLVPSLEGDDELGPLLLRGGQAGDAPEPGPKVEEGIQTELDEALEEFSRVAEEEEAEEMRVEGKGLEEDGARKQDHTKPRRGRPPRWLKEQTMQMGEIARKKEEQAGPVADQAQVINEVMKKYPNLFKDNKQV